MITRLSHYRALLLSLGVLLAPSSLLSQVSFLAGAPGDVYCTKPVSPCVAGRACLYTDLTGSPTTMLYGYGTPITCNLPTALPVVDVFLGFWEPNQTGANTRTIEIWINGVKTATPVRPYVLAGNRLKALGVTTISGVTPVGGMVKLDFKTSGTYALTGNPEISMVSLSPPPIPGPVGPQGQAGPRGDPGPMGPPGMDGRMLMVIQPQIQSNVDWSKVMIPGHPMASRTVTLESVVADPGTVASWSSIVGKAANLLDYCYRIATTPGQATPILMTESTQAVCEATGYYPLWFKASEVQ